MKQNATGTSTEQTSLWLILFVLFPFHFIPTILIYNIFSFEVALLFGISLAIAMISMGFAGIENTIKKLLDKTNLH